MKSYLRILSTLLIIALGSAIYAVATQFFIFSNDIFLGGTSGVSVILSHFFPHFSSAEFLMIINVGLMVLALIILGRDMAVKTMVGSALTTLFIGLAERIAPRGMVLIANPVISAMAGASMIAAGSAILFYIDSSSGGTDIIALIIRKYSHIPIGKALLIADVLVVVVGALVSPLGIAIASVIGLLIKTLGIDAITGLIVHARPRHVH